MGRKKGESGSRACLFSLNSITIDGKGVRDLWDWALEAELPVILILPVLNHWVNKGFSLSSEVQQILLFIYGCALKHVGSLVPLPIKKAEHRRIDAFKLWCWRRLLRVPWTARRSNQSILKEISPEYSLEGLMLKLKLQYFGHVMRRTDSLKKTLMLGKIEGRRKRGR